MERENRCFEEVASNRGGAWETYCWPLSLMRVRGALIYRYNYMPSRFDLIQFPLNSKMVVGSTLGYMICPAPGFRHYNGDMYISFILCSKTSILIASVWLPWYSNYYWTNTVGISSSATHYCSMRGSNLDKVFLLPHGKHLWALWKLPRRNDFLGNSCSVIDQAHGLFSNRVYWQGLEGSQDCWQ